MVEETSLEKSEWDHKSGLYVQVVKRMHRSINLFQIQDIPNHLLKTEWLQTELVAEQRHQKLLVGKNVLCCALPAISYISVSAY